jgi:tetratricopeptide (TPR) repeat protein
MRFRILSATVAGLMVLQISSLAAQTRPQPKIPLPTRSIYELLDRYAGGDVTAAREFAHNPAPKQIQIFEEQVGRWISANRSTLPKRRLAAASFVLDASREWQGTLNWVYARRLISWACHEFAAPGAPAQPGEELWYQASIALLGGAEDWWFLIGRSGFNGGRRAGRAPIDDEVFQGHIAHAAARFPNDPRFALAAAVSIESLSWEVGALGRDPNRRGIVAGEIEPDALARVEDSDDLQLAALGRPPKRGLSAGPGVAEVRRVARSFETLSTEPPIAAEAHIRAGLVAYRIANHEQALVHLTQVVKLTDDPYLIYLSRLIEGIVWERQSRDEEAVTAYRAALQAVPRAQSASTMLVARLIKLGRLAEAAQVAEGFFASGPPPADPWRLYRLGDFRSWTSLMTRLRAEFQ